MYDINQHKALLAKIANAKPLTDYGDRIPLGTHKLALKEYTFRPTDSSGIILAADFVTLESESLKKGSVVGVAWFISQGEQWKIEKEHSRAKMFVAALLNLEDPAQIQAEMERLADPAQGQPGRGIMVMATGIGKMSKGKGGKEKKEYITVTFGHVPQTRADILANRAMIDAMDARGAAQEQAHANHPANTTAPHVAQTPAPAAPPPPAALNPLPPGWPVGAPVPPGFYNPATHDPYGRPLAGGGLLGGMR